MKILILGCGFQGKRHALNLRDLGAEVFIYDTDQTQMAWTIQEKFEWVEEIKGDYDGAVIATPPEFHMDNIQECEKYKIDYILVEKPLSLKDNFGVEYRAYLTTSNKIMMAHNYLFSPELWKFKREMIAPLRADRRWEYVSADYLVNWHGPEFANNYQKRHEAIDGCMAVSVSHAIYILDYLFGMPDREEYYKDNFPGVETKGDNAVTGVRINEWSNVILIESWAAKERQHYLKEINSTHGFNWVHHNEDVLNSHKLMMSCFLDVVKGAREVPELCRLSEGIRIVQQIEKARYLTNDYT